MTYKQLKWLILMIPTVTIGIWEYVRHVFLLPYISMEVGNWLSPLFVLLVSLLLLTKLFSKIERSQEELNSAKAIRTVLEERERIARELHDGIAQSLFFLNAQMIGMKKAGHAEAGSIDKMKETVRRINDYVRQAIANLRHEPDTEKISWLQAVESLIDDMRRETGMQVDMNWAIPESALTSREKVELLAIMREALLNVHKHAAASWVSIRATAVEEGWMCRISDNGQGFTSEAANQANRYGLKMMRDRADSMCWRLHFERAMGEMSVTIAKEAVPDAGISSVDCR